MCRSIGCWADRQEFVGADDSVGPFNVADLHEIRMKSVHSAGGAEPRPYRDRAFLECFEIYRIRIPSGASRQLPLKEEPLGDGGRIFIVFRPGGCNLGAKRIE